MEEMLKEDRRHAYQIKQYDEHNNLIETVIPAYKFRDNFMDKYEKELYRCLIQAVAKIRNDFEQYYTIFAQVSLNRIFDVNDMREYNNLFRDIVDRSVDFVIYDNKREYVHRCIELVGSSHDDTRKKRDNMVDKLFKHYEKKTKLVWITIHDTYDIDDLIQKIMF